MGPVLGVFKPWLDLQGATPLPTAWRESQSDFPGSSFEQPKGRGPEIQIIRAAGISVQPLTRGRAHPRVQRTPRRKVKMKPNCYLIKGHTPAWDKRSTWLGLESMTTQLPHWQWAGLGNKSIRLPISLTLLLSTQTGLLVRDKKGAIILGKWGKNHLPQRNPWKITKTTTIKTINLQIYK